MSKRQLTLSSFFTKKTDTNAPNAKRPKNVETNDTGMAEQTTTPPSSSPIDSSPSNSGSPAKSPPRMHNRRDPEAAAKRHERFVEKFAQLERDREAKRRRVDTPQAYSPLELQVLELKRKHPGVLLAIEVGYKFRFFGEDAKVRIRGLQTTSKHSLTLLLSRLRRVYCISLISWIETFGWRVYQHIAWLYMYEGNFGGMHVVYCALCIDALMMIGWCMLDTRSGLYDKPRQLPSKQLDQTKAPLSNASSSNFIPKAHLLMKWIPLEWMRKPRWSLLQAIWFALSRKNVVEEE